MEIQTINFARIFAGFEITSRYVLATSVIDSDLEEVRTTSLAHVKPRGDVDILAGATHRFLILPSTNLASSIYAF
jgi:hypothetical protein